MFTDILDFFSNDNNNINGDSDKFRVSNVVYYDELHHHATNYEDNDTFVSSLMPIEIKPGEIYTKQELQEVLASLANCGMFEEIDMECTTNRDQTVKVTFYYTEKTWSSKDYFRCINVGVTQPQTKINSDNTKLYEVRSCLLPPSVHEEVVAMMRDEGEEGLSGRMLCKIKERVEKWYHDEGYIAAQVVRFNNMYTKELVCELVEGKIEKLVLFDGKNYINELPNTWKKLCNKVEVGNVYNIKANKQVMKNLMSLGLLSKIELDSYLDETKGGVVVEIRFRYKDKSHKIDTEFIESSSLINIIKSTFVNFF